MHPHVRQDHPGSCPICGMDLVPSGAASHAHGLQLDSASIQRLGVRLAAARRQVLSRDIVTVGTVAVAENREFNVTSKVEGSIRSLHVASTGQPVKVGEVLYEILSPELLQTQREYIALLREKDAMVARMSRVDGHSARAGMSAEDVEMMAKSTAERMRARERLIYADAGEELVEELDRTYRPREVVPVRAARAGTVVRIPVREGSVVRAADSVLVLADLSELRIDVPLYPDQLSWVRTGDRASFALPPQGQPAGGPVAVIDAVAADGTHASLARVSVANPGQSLRIGSFLDVTIHARPHSALSVPRSAVMRTGRGDAVMLSDSEGHFAPTAVRIGIETPEWTEITDGLQSGDQVAVNGQFLLESAASLQDAAERTRVDRDAGHPR